MLKQLFCALSHRTGLNALVRRGYRDRLLTVCYHNVLPDEAIPATYLFRNTIGVARLREQLRILGSYFTFVSPQDVLRSLEGGALPRAAALVTFDDGYANWSHHAAPLLTELGVPALFHVCSGAIASEAPLWFDELVWMLEGWLEPRVPTPQGGTIAAPEGGAGLPTATLRALHTACKAMPDDDRRRYLERVRAARWRVPPAEQRAAFAVLDWEQVRDLHARGFGVGSHTVSHPILTSTGVAALDHELAASKRHIEQELGAPCPWLAYPNGARGDVSPLVMQRAAHAGYRMAFTTVDPFSAPRDQPFAVGRWCVPSRVSTSTFRALCSGVRLRWEALRAAR